MAGPCRDKAKDVLRRLPLPVKVGASQIAVLVSVCACMTYQAQEVSAMGVNLKVVMADQLSEAQPLMLV